MDWENHLVKKNPIRKIENIAGRLLENSRNSFVDLQSKNIKKTDQEKFVCSLKADMLHFGKKSVEVFAASISCFLKTFI